MADDILQQARDFFERAETAESENRAAALDDIAFSRLADQWPSAIKHAREADHRPCLTINRLPAFIRQVTNDARLNKPSIAVHPVDDRSDPDTADVLTGLIRNIQSSSDADTAYITALEYAVSGGFGYFRVDLDYSDEDAFDLDIEINRILNPFTVYGDPSSTLMDSSDWNECLVTEWINKRQFERQYGEQASKSNWDATSGDSNWISDDEVRVAEYWVRDEIQVPIVMLSDGTVISADRYAQYRDLYDAAMVQVVRERMSTAYKVTQHILTGLEVLETNPWPGKFIPIVPVYGDEVMSDGKRHFRSLIRDAKDPQRMFNYWRTTATELVALAPRAPWIGPVGAFNTDGNWDTANTENHPYLEYDGATPPTREPFAGPPAGALQEALNSADDMKAIMGIYDASLGARSNETSGKAIIARQREGDVGTFHFIDNLGLAIRHAGRILVDLIPKVYDKPRVIRILGEDDSPDTVRVNQPIEIKGQERIYDLTTGKYDVTISTGPGFSTRREEAATQMTEMIRAYPAAAPYIGDLLAKNLDWPGADEIAKRLKALLPPHLQDDNEEIPPQIVQQIEQGKQLISTLQQELAKTKQVVDQKLIEKQIKEVERDVKVMEAEVSVLEAQNAAKEAENRSRELDLEESKLSMEAGAMAAEVGAKITALQQMVDESRTANRTAKTISITAPSGKTYTGRLDAGEVQVMTPEGETYEGTIH